MVFHLDIAYAKKSMGSVVMSPVQFPGCTIIGSTFRDAQSKIRLKVGEHIHSFSNESEDLSIIKPRFFEDSIILDIVS